MMLMNKVRLLAASNRDAGRLYPQGLEAALVKVNGCSSCSTPNIQDRPGSNEANNPVDFPDRE